MSLNTDSIISSLLHQLSRVDEYCIPSKSIFEETLRILVIFYDLSTKYSKKSFGAFSNLDVDGFDSETIWEIIQTRNRPLVRYLQKSVQKLLKSLDADKDTYNVDDRKVKSNEKSVNIESNKIKTIHNEEGSDYSTEGNLVSNKNKSHIKSAKRLEGDHDKIEEQEIDGSEDQDFDDEMEENVDEDIEGEDEIDAYLDQMEMDEELHREKEEKRLLRKGSKGILEEDAVDDEDDFDLIERELYNTDDEEEEEDDGEEEGGAGGGIMYEDFFGDKTARRRVVKVKKPELRNSGLGEEDEGGGSDGSDAELEFDDAADDYHDDDGDEGEEFANDHDEDEEEQEEVGSETGESVGSRSGSGSGKDRNASSAALTKAAKYREKLRDEISELETEALAPKPWELRGEVRAVDRPENSLLELATQVERASKPVPIITQEHSSTLEDLIKKRIKDSIFDDVVPKDPNANKRPDSQHDELDLSQEKSKKGLGEVYADEFRKQTLGVTEEVGPDGLSSTSALETEITQLFEKVCRKLDALSHFNFSPRPIVREASVSVSQALPALSLEDIGPVTESSAATAAPEEVLSKKRGRQAALLSEQELTSDDKKRLRRASKNAKKRSLVDKSDSPDENDPGSLNDNVKSNKKSKKSGKVLKEKDSKKNADNYSGDGAAKTSFKSADFFNRLQQEAVQKISKVASNSKTEKGDNVSGLKSAAVKL